MILSNHREGGGLISGHSPPATNMFDINELTKVALERCATARSGSRAPQSDLLRTECQFLDS